jgi:hypothetical protein
MEIELLQERKDYGCYASCDMCRPVWLVDVEDGWISRVFLFWSSWCASLPEFSLPASDSLFYDAYVEVYNFTILLSFHDCNIV